MRPFIHFALCVLVACAAAPASALAPITSDIIETSADKMSMPATSDGSLVIARCTQCPPTTLQATAATVFMIEKKTVTLKEFAAFTRSNGSAFVAVTYDKSTRRLLRLKATVPVLPSAR
jgi:hypothetical protein